MIKFLTAHLIIPLALSSYGLAEAAHRFVHILQPNHIHHHFSDEEQQRDHSSDHDRHHDHDIFFVNIPDIVISGGLKMAPPFRANFFSALPYYGDQINDPILSTVVTGKDPPFPRTCFLFTELANKAPPA